jgi:ABC-2 type transport system ATP-binding protein
MNLTVTNLRKDFATVRAVDGVSFDVTPGQILGLLGPNGAGKTTTIRIILHILEADEGNVTYDGSAFSSRVRNLVGYLPEERGLYRKSKVMDTILYFAALRGMGPSHAHVSGQRWLERFSLGDAGGRRIQELSKGNQQKVQFIASVIHDPPLVILDEPFSGLDPMNQIILKDAMQEMKQQGKAVIFSTHQMEQAERLSDTICLINRGKVVLGGSVRDVKQRYGKNSLHVEFDGNGSFLSSLPGVHRAILFERAAELELASGTSVRTLIAAINERVDVRKVEILEPSLQSIFLQIVGDDALADAPVPQAPGGRTA